MMLDLASYMVYATITVFAVGAAVALWWSIAAGQWRDLDTAKYIVFADEPEVLDA